MKNNITIIGWYGTETIGDRAILAGILLLLSSYYKKLNINLGSLYPFFTERTLYEDFQYWEKITHKEIIISVFDSSNKNELDNAIDNSSIIIMGGGPLMHIKQMYMIAYAFVKAKKKGKITGIFGCGIGPLFIKSYYSVLKIITWNSDFIILRDSSSMEILDACIDKSYNKTMKYKKVGIDPAFFCAEFFLRNTSILKNKNAISINFREFPLDYTKQNSSLLGSKINDALKRFLTEICRIYNDKIITLIPMHYFYIGNDDRLFLNKIAMQIGVKNLRVQNVPLSLEETMETFANSYLCVGMRFHSILLQTLLNGNNYIFDYTEPGTGKINGFLNDLDKDDFYINRYISLHAIETDNNIESFIASFSNSSACFKLNENIFISKKQVFRDVLESIL